MLSSCLDLIYVLYSEEFQKEGGTWGQDCSSWDRVINNPSPSARKTWLDDTRMKECFQPQISYSGIVFLVAEKSMVISNELGHTASLNWLCSGLKPLASGLSKWAEFTSGTGLLWVRSKGIKDQHTKVRQSFPVSTPPCWSDLPSSGWLLLGYANGGRGGRAWRLSWELLPGVVLPLAAKRAFLQQLCDPSQWFICPHFAPCDVYENSLTPRQKNQGRDLLGWERLHEWLDRHRNLQNLFTCCDRGWWFGFPSHSTSVLI